MHSENWLEIELECVGTEIKAKAQGPGDTRASYHSFGPALDVESLHQFSQEVEQAATQARSLALPTLKQAQTIHQALFQGTLNKLLERQRGAAGNEKLLLRLMLPSEGSLQAFPWEALCAPDTLFGFLGNSTDVLLARGVSSMERLVPREVREKVRVLAIAPAHEEALLSLRSALEERIASGEIEWLDPVVGRHARPRYLHDRLMLEPIPHILHFLGHGSVDEKGMPRLRLADEEDGTENWISVEVLAKQLRSFRKCLRLIVLEACEGARPGIIASAAEWLTRCGADAVIAHLWPVKTDMAEACSRAFYRALTGTAERPGDVAYSLSQARLAMLSVPGESAEAFSPVLYLRGNDPILFDFNIRATPAPSPPPPSSPVASDARFAPLHKLMEQSSTLVLGDGWKEEGALLKSFRHQLGEVLARKLGPRHSLSPLSMSALTQHYALHFGEGALEVAFQRAFKRAFEEMSRSSSLVQWVGWLAPQLKPGFHITLLRYPLLEHFLLESQPDRSLYVIQPVTQPIIQRTEEARGELATLFKLDRAGQLGEPLEVLPESFDLCKDLVILRKYSGYIAPEIFKRPLITEDHYLLGINGLEAMLTQEAADVLKGQLNNRPALLLGLSMLTWHHRMLLYRLFNQLPLPKGSLALTECGQGELWAQGRSLLAGGRVRVIELCDGALDEPLEEMRW